MYIVQYYISIYLHTENIMMICLGGFGNPALPRVLIVTLTFLVDFTGKLNFR